MARARMSPTVGPLVCNGFGQLQPVFSFANSLNNCVLPESLLVKDWESRAGAPCFYPAPREPLVSRLVRTPLSQRPGRGALPLLCFLLA